MINESFKKLKVFCEKEGYKGYDPYDGLNSKLFQSLPLIRSSRLCRLVWTQLFKRLPLNLRPLVGIKKGYNAKGLALFLSSYCALYTLDIKVLKTLELTHSDIKETIKSLADQLIELKTEGYSGACWGYNFDWQARAFFQPKGRPTVVASTFIAYALLDAYDISFHEPYKKIAISVKDFILKDLNRTYDGKGNFAFSYSPLDSRQVFNASLLGSRLLSRIFFYTGDKSLLVESKKSVQYCVDHQRLDGSWTYGRLPYHQWVDNFHTGYNLECISEYQKYSRDYSYSENIERGLEYYLKTFFTDKGISKYYSNKKYPIDIHSPAQLVVTLSRLGKIRENNEMLNKVLEWTISNMQDPKGFFYFQKKRHISSKIAYMRWAQAWMFYVLSTKIINDNS